MPKRVLILACYYPPDLSAGSFRAKSLVDALLEADPEVQVDVITTTPNRYTSFAAEASHRETIGRLGIERVRVGKHKGDMLSQALGYLPFAKHAFQTGRDKSYDLVIAATSRLMTGVIGGIVSGRTKTRFHLDVRDIFSETIEDVLHGHRAKALLPLIRAMERFAYRRASSVSVVSEAFTPYLSRYAPAEKFSFHPNGIDDVFVTTSTGSKRERDHQALILFAGNVSEGQGLDHVIPAAARTLQGRAKFRIVGDGGRLRELREGIACSGVQNVELLDPVPREQLLKHYNEADMLLVHLNAYNAFERVLPSKLFEYGATGLPILAGVSGYSAAFLRREMDGCAVFDPCDSEGLVTAFERLKADAEVYDRADFIMKYKRTSIMKKLAEQILA